MWEYQEGDKFVIARYPVKTDGGYNFQQDCESAFKQQTPFTIDYVGFGVVRFTGWRGEWEINLEDILQYNPQLEND